MKRTPDLANEKYNHRLAAGCGFLLIISFFVIAFGLVSFVKQDRRKVQYPGSVPIATHSNYASLPRTYRWDDSFRIDDEFTAVYNWYSINFNMGAESRANGSCILLETDNQFLRAERFMTVFICSTLEGQLVFVSRTTTFK